MSMRYKGGVISATPPTTSTSAATGVWTLVQQMQAQGAGTWPIVVGGNYFIGVLNIGVGTPGNPAFLSNAVDSSGNVYLCSSSSVGGVFAMQIAKYNKLGSIQWQRRLGDASLGGGGSSIAVDSSGNVYVCGTLAVSGNGFLIAKYNTSGTLQWQTQLRTGVGGSNTNPCSIALDSSNNVYVTGYSRDSTPAFLSLSAKYNTSGTLQWQKSFQMAGGGNFGYGNTADPSGNVYVCGLDAGLQIAKFDTSGTVQWQRTFGSSASSYGRSVVTDSSGNVYVCGTTYLTANASNEFLIVKYDTSGTLQWQKSLGNTQQEYGWSIAIDSANNIYVCGDSYQDGTGTSNIQIAKYNSSGTIQWQRYLGLSGLNDFGRSVAVDISNNIYVSGFSNTSGSDYNFLFVKLPGDGSLTGTYSVGSNSFTYAASGLTDTTLSLTSSTSSLTSANTSLFDSTALADAASSLTSSVTTI